MLSFSCIKFEFAINPIQASFHMLFSYFSCPPSVNRCFIFFAHSSITLPGLLLFVYTMSLYFNFLLIVYIPNIFARSICSVLHETEIVKFDVINYTIFFLMVYAFFPPLHVRNTYPLCYKKNSLTLFYNNCIVLSFTFRALFQWESFLVLCYSIVWVSFLFFLQIFCQFS